MNRRIASGVLVMGLLVSVVRKQIFLVVTLMVCSILSACNGQEAGYRPPPSSVEGSDELPDRAAEASERREFERNMQVCLEDRGFVVLHEDDGTWGIETQPNDPTSSQFALEAVSDCREQLGPPEPAPLADHEFHLLYADRLKQAECLRDMGIEISVAPSESRYVEIYRRSLDGGTEMPWEPLAEVPDSLLESAMEVCPQTPLEDLH